MPDDEYDNDAAQIQWQVLPLICYLASIALVIGFVAYIVRVL